MRVLWLRGVTLTVAALLAAAMLALNGAFEAMGNIPDIEGCRFLAGNLAALFALYPLMAALVAGRTARLLARRAVADEETLVRIGGKIGFKAGVLYFGLGLIDMIRRDSFRGFPAMLFVVLALYLLACWIGGRIGALVAVERNRTLAFGGEEG